MNKNNMNVTDTYMYNIFRGYVEGKITTAAYQLGFQTYPVLV